jgi:hypothetical protein
MSNYIEHYKEIHLKNPKYGSNNDPAAKPVDVLSLIQKNDCEYVLDYGCGKGVLVEFLNNNNIICEGFDPAVEEFLNKPSYETGYDCITCLDVLEHIPYNDIDDLLSDICSFESEYTFFNIALRKASQLLPDGSNAHLIVEDKDWWIDKIQNAFTKHKIITIIYKPEHSCLFAIQKNLFKKLWFSSIMKFLQCKSFQILFDFNIKSSKLRS